MPGNNQSIVSPPLFEDVKILIKFLLHRFFRAGR